MKRRLFLLPVLFFALISCSENAQERIDLINNTESELYDDSKDFDAAKADMLIRNYDQFAQDFPEHELAPSCLFKAGDLSSGLEKSQQAIDFFDRVISKYPDFEKASDALFLKAFVLDNQLKDYDEAKAQYQLFIDQYPDHDLAQSAQFSIQNLGKTPEELIKQFEQNMQADTNQVSQ